MKKEISQQLRIAMIFKVYLLLLFYLIFIVVALHKQI